MGFFGSFIESFAQHYRPTHTRIHYCRKGHVKWAYEGRGCHTCHQEYEQRQAEYESRRRQNAQEKAERLALNQERHQEYVERRQQNEAERSARLAENEARRVERERSERRIAEVRKRKNEAASRRAGARR